MSKSRHFSKANRVAQNRKATGRYLERMAKHKPRQRRTRRMPTQQHDLTWQTLLILLILCPYTLGLTNREIYRQAGGKPIERLPDNATCTQKTIGQSSGKVCDITVTSTPTTLFMKKVPTQADVIGPIATPGFELHSYEHFNQLFVRDVIGIAAPIARFVFEPTDATEDDYFIATEKVSGIQFSDSYEGQITNAELGAQGKAKLAVAMTFIGDLHNLNWGYTKTDGLTLIDVDSAGKRPDTLADYFELTYKNLTYAETPWLSIDDIDDMLSIYTEMRTKPLPKQHYLFGLEKDDYQLLLTIYQHSCIKTIEQFGLNHPAMARDESDASINEALAKHIGLSFQKCFSAGQMTNNPTYKLNKGI